VPSATLGRASIYGRLCLEDASEQKLSAGKLNVG
jgi:hypothetical protein